MKARNKDIIYTVLSTTKKRIDIGPQEEVEKCPEVVKAVVMSVARGKKYVTVAVTYASK